MGGIAGGEGGSPWVSLSPLGSLTAPRVSHSPPWSLTVPWVSHSPPRVFSQSPQSLTVLPGLSQPPRVSHSPLWSLTAPWVSHSPRVSHSPLTCSGLKSVSCCESPPGSLLPHVLLLSHGGDDHWLPWVFPALSLE